MVVVVVSYRTPQLVQQCLAAVAGELEPGLDAALVVDNASGDGSADAIEAWATAQGLADRVTVLRSPRNGGFAAGNNLAFAAVAADTYLLVNSDCMLDPGTAAALRAELRAHPECGAVGPRIVNARGAPAHSAFRFKTPLSELIDGCSLGAVTKALRRFDVLLPVPVPPPPSSSPASLPAPSPAPAPSASPPPSSSPPSPSPSSPSSSPPTSSRPSPSPPAPSLSPSPASPSPPPASERAPRADAIGGALSMPGARAADCGTRADQRAKAASRAVAVAEGDGATAGSRADAAIEADWISFACALLRGRAVREVGPMDEGFFLYFEDMDYCAALRRAGWRILHWPVPRALHSEGGSTGLATADAQRGRRPRYYYESRARYFAKRFGLAGLWLANLARTAGLLVDALRPLCGRARRASRRELLDIWIGCWRPLRDRRP